MICILCRISLSLRPLRFVTFNPSNKIFPSVGSVSRRIVRPRVDLPQHDPYLDKEALRVINSMPKWKPGMQRGKAVRVKYTVPVMFRLQ